METRDYWRIWLLGILPDVALSWGYMKLSDDRWASFGWFLLALVVAQTFFSIKEIASGSLIYRLYGKDRVSDGVAQELRDRQYPVPIRDEDFESYMSRIIENEDNPFDVRLHASASLASFQAQTRQGLFVALRLAAAYDLAVNKYADRCG